MDFKLSVSVGELAEDEWLLRSLPVPDERPEQLRYPFTTNDSGLQTLSVSVFNDREYQPSVDRLAILRDPNLAKKNSTDAVVKISTAQIIDMTNAVESGKRRHYAIDDPTPESPTKAANEAHAKIMTDPAIKKSNSDQRYWKNLKQLLALAACEHGWVVSPDTQAIAEGAASQGVRNPARAK